MLKTFNLNDLVYKGVWTDYNASTLWRRTLTLKDSEALVCLACISVLLAFTQTRSWVLLRFAIYQRTKSPRLPDPINPDFRQQISQGKAIMVTISMSKRKLKRVMHKVKRTSSSSSQQSLEIDDNLVIPSIFGLIALFNVILFLSMGILIPWTLSDGSMKTPIVRSRVTEKCLTAQRADKLSEIWAKLPETDMIFQQCNNRLYGDCIAQAYLKQPIIRKERTKRCPFQGDICRNDTLSIELTHNNVSARDVGVNTFTKVYINHRLTCAPISLDPFYEFTYTNSTPKKPRSAGISILDASFPIFKGRTLYNGYATLLHTLNGPNNVSNENSGLQVVGFNKPSSLTILPHVFKRLESDMQHPSVRTNDSMPFMVIYSAGNTYHMEPSDDPIFSAHSHCVINEVVYNGTGYCADQEATALGCSEKFQFCLEGSECTGWGVESGAAYQLLEHPSVQSNDDIMGDILTLYRMIPSMLSVHWYLGMRTSFFGSTATPVARDSSPVVNAYDLEPWATEVETWFVKATIDAIQFGRYGARFPLDEQSEYFDEELRRKYALCGRILFRHGSYTNLSWIGCWIAISVCISICLASYCLETLCCSILKGKRIITKVPDFLRLQYIAADGTLSSWWLRTSWHRNYHHRWFNNDTAREPSGHGIQMNDIETMSMDARIHDGPVDPRHENIDGVI